MESAHQPNTRRDFLRRLSVWTAITAGCIAAISLLRQFMPRLTAHQRVFKIGRKNNYPLNTFTYLSDRKMFVYRDHEGLRAVSAVCTHLGCIIEQSDEGFQCPCHGSCYDEQGRVLSGAATKDLPWYALSRDVDGQILVDQGREVDAGEILYV